MTNKKEIALVTADNVKQLAFDVGDVTEILQLANDLIDFMPNVRDSKVQDDPLFFYGATQEALSNVFKTNQGVLKKLDDVVVSLYEMTDELEELNELKGFVDDKWLISEEEKTFKSFDEFKNDPNRDGVTGAELKHYREQGYSFDEILLKVCTIDSETGRIEKEFPQTTNNK